MAGTSFRRRVQRLRGPDAVGKIRRNVASAVDRVWAPTAKRLRRPPRVRHDPDADPRVALITVNLSTTHYLKLMLVTLSDQRALSLLSQIVIVDNGSLDGGVDFIRTLASNAERVSVVERHRFRSHAHGMRAGAAAVQPEATHLLFCDTDVIWRSPHALLDLMAMTVAIDAALAGEIRLGANAQPDIQASLFMVRRDVYEDPHTPPLLNNGSPAYRLQRSIFDRGFAVANFPANFGGFTLHRGRAGVEAAARHPRHAYSRARNRYPHYMGVPNGAAIWSETEARFAALVDPGNEAMLIRHLTERLEQAE